MKRSKFLSLTMASLISLGALVGCGGTPAGPSSSGGESTNEPQGDSNKVVLTVATYDGGIGHKWLEDAEKRFEAIYGNSTQFGKEGVDVVVSYNKGNYNGENLFEKRQLDKDVYLTEGVDYAGFVKENLVADITDVAKGAAYGETVEVDGTIEDKLDESFKEFLTANDAGKYYMLPFYDGFYGFIYDIDLFEEQGFYIGSNGAFIARNEGETQEAFDARKSAGPNGVAGDYDDGLPATYAEFESLLKQITKKSITPFAYSGKYTGYVNKACRSFAIDYEGYEGSRINYTLFGEDVDLIKVDDSGKITHDTMDINESNAYELQRQAGRYYAMMMEEKLFGSVDYIGSYNSDDFTKAQDKFVKSFFTGDQYAMLVDGVWWENEAENSFTFSKNTWKKGKEDRRFGLLPLPKADASRAGEQTLFSANRSFCFVNKNCANMDLAKEFVRFLHSDAEMSKFTAKTSVPRSFNYDVSAEDRVSATYYGKAIIDMRAQSKVVYPYSSSKLVLNNPTTFGADEWYFSTTIGSDIGIINPFVSFKGETTAISYFNGMYTYHKDQWNKLRK